MKNNSYLKTWWLARRGLKLHWLITAGLCIPLLISVIVLWFKGQSLIPVLMMVTWAHASIVGYFTKEHFFERKFPILPRRIHRGLFYSFMEWAINLAALAIIIATLFFIDPSLAAFGWNTILSLLASWWMGWIVMFILSQIGMWAIFVMVAGLNFHSPSDDIWQLWQFLIIGSATSAVFINSRKLKVTGTTTGRKSRFAGKRLRPTKPRSINLYQIQVDIFTQHKPNAIFRLVGLEFLLTTITLMAGITVHSILNLIRGDTFWLEDKERINAYITLIFIRLLLKITLGPHLGTAFPYLPGISRDTWQKRHQLYTTISRVATFASLSIVPIGMDFIASRIIVGAHLFSPAFQYYLLPIFLFTLFGAFYSMIMASVENRGIFSEIDKSSIFAQSMQNPTYSIGHTVMAVFYMLLPLTIGIILATSFPETFRNVAQGKYLVYWLPAYVFLLGTFIWQERRWTIKAFSEGDLM